MTCSRAGLLLALVLLAVPLRAQQTFGVVEDRQTNVPSYFFHVLPGEATIGVYVWGTVRNPGLYEVGATTDLGELLTLAGGPALQPETDEQVVTTTVRLYHFVGDQRTMAYERQVEAMLREGTYPALQNGDIVEVETAIKQRGGFSWRDALTIVTGVAAVAVAVERISSLL